MLLRNLQGGHFYWDTVYIERAAAPPQTRTLTPVVDSLKSVENFDFWLRLLVAGTSENIRV